MPAGVGLYHGPAPLAEGVSQSAAVGAITHEVPAVAQRVQRVQVSGSLRRIGAGGTPRHRNGMMANVMIYFRIGAV